MDFNHTEDRRMLADMAGRFVREQYPIEKRHEIAAGETGMSDEMWSAMAELGLIGALFPEEAGGFGGAGFDVTVVFEELGKGLVVEPFLPALLAGRVLQSGSDAQLEMLGELISGEVKVALAHGEPASRYTLNHVEMSATQSGDAYILSGNKEIGRASCRERV